MNHRSVDGTVDQRAGDRPVVQGNNEDSEDSDASFVRPEIVKWPPGSFEEEEGGPSGSAGQTTR